MLSLFSKLIKENIIQSEFEQYDFELGGIENAITIQQIN